MTLAGNRCLPARIRATEQGQLLLAVPCPVFGVEDLDDAVRRTVDCVDSPLAAFTEHRTEHKCPGVSASRREAHGIPGPRAGLRSPPARGQEP